MSKVIITTTITTNRFVDKFNKAAEKETRGMSRIAKANVKALSLYKVIMFDIVMESKNNYFNNNKEN